MFQKDTPHQPAHDESMQSQALAFPPIGTTLPSPHYGGTLSAVPLGPLAAETSKQQSRGLVKRFFIGLLILALLAVGYVGAKFLINAARSLDGSLFGLLQNDELKGEAEGRVNILLAGNSADDPGHGGAELTDSIMLVSVDTKNKTAFMLSIPRDLYVELPDGNSYQKINTVYPYGKENGFYEPDYPEGGMGALAKVVSTNFGLPVHYYALVNYTAFRDAVNAVGGIDVVIESEDPRGLYDAMIAKADGGPLRLPNGPQHLDGQTALNLARARGSGISYGFAASDYTRSQHQRMMLAALRSKAVSAGVLSNPIKVGSLLDSIGKNVETDIKTSEVRRLYSLTKDIPDDKISSVGLNDVNGRSLLRSYNARGQSALIPAAGLNDYSDIQAYLESLTAPPDVSTPGNE